MSYLATVGNQLLGPAVETANKALILLGESDTLLTPSQRSHQIPLHSKLRKV